jgi:Subtilase family
MSTRARTQPIGADEPVLIYIHGVGPQLPREALKQQWDLALFGRELGERSRMAYWCDALHAPAAAGGKNTGTAQSAKTAKVEPTAWQAALNNEQAAALADFERRLMVRMGAPLLSDDAPRTGAVKKVLPLPAWARRPAGKAFLKAFVQDTAAYFFAVGQRARIQQRLRAELAAAGSRPITLVAHSQGSVIAHEVLSAMRGKLPKIEAFITIGSPLGIQELQDLLQPAPLEVPRVLRRWSNFADPLDPVALDKSLASDFAPSELGTRIQDEIIVNSYTRKLWGFNPHAAVGYLAHPSVRRAVNGALRMDSMARFVLARDVTERLGADAEERHPVLIEVLEPGYRALDETPQALLQAEASELAKKVKWAKQTRQVRGMSAEAVDGSLRLEDRIQHAAEALLGIVSDVKAARIDPLRRFVAAHLTASELQQVGVRHRELRVYAVWLSSRKSKLTDRRSLGAIKADAALTSFAADGAGITWAVLDTGIQADHPHFKDSLAAVYDCTQPGPPRLVRKAEDADGHGTHVAGIIAGRSVPAKQPKRTPAKPEDELRGVAPRTRLVVYKVLDDEGFGEDAWTIKALDHIAQQNENVTAGLAVHGVNLSLGGPFDHTVYGCGFSPICAELRRLWRNGVLVVVACGNEGQLQVQTRDGEVEINTPMSVGDPANLEECIAVGAVNADRPYLYGVSSFSSRGPTADGRAKPDVVAPGERILSCNAHWRSSGGAPYVYNSGTSMAAPHVSGLLAAFLSVRREFRGRPDEVKKILMEACSDLGRDRYHQGRGLPNLMQMLLSV